MAEPHMPFSALGEALLRASPAKFFRLLLAVHDRQDWLKQTEAIYIILPTMTWQPPPAANDPQAEAHMDRMLREGLAETIMQVVVDEASFICDSPPNTLRECADGAIYVVLETLTYLGNQFRSKPDVKSIRHIMDRIPDFWSMIWTHRDSLLGPDLGGDIESLDFSLSTVICAMIEKVMALRGIFGDQIKFIDTGLDIYLYCWTTSKASRPNGGGLYEHVLVDLCEAMFSDYVKSKIHASLIETELGVVFLRKVYKLLREPDTLDRLLRDTLCILVACLTASEALRDLALSTNHLDPLYDTVRAWHRQMCLGNRYTFQMAGIILLIACRIIRKRDDNHRVFFPSACNGNILSMISYYLLDVQAEDERKKMALHIIGLHIDLALLVKQPASQNYKDAFHILRKIWLPTLQELRGRINPAGVKSADTIELWQYLGRAFGLRENDAPAQLFPGFTSCTKSCRWKDCLCSCNKPWHRLRVCKGCWRALYCSSKCQTRSKDWKVGGHKEECKRWRKLPDE
ncbi:unnamed protein product [Somion occarium]|uniref:MYND-type domain-containing protein n=1 Tax=Somion occarium TaxID=3059160 RepID=A0ABP1DXC2_9APHY